jgi:hypothetical protein
MPQAVYNIESMLPIDYAGASDRIDSSAVPLWNDRVSKWNQAIVFPELITAHYAAEVRTGDNLESSFAVTMFKNEQPVAHTSASLIDGVSKINTTERAGRNRRLNYTQWGYHDADETCGAPACCFIDTTGRRGRT